MDLLEGREIDYADLILADGIESEIYRKRQLAEELHQQELVKWEHSFTHRLAQFLRKLVYLIDIPEPVEQPWWRLKEE